jgi:hypothetical protein
VPASRIQELHRTGTEPAGATIDSIDALAQRRQILDADPEGAGRRRVSRGVGACNGSVPAIITRSKAVASG